MFYSHWQYKKVSTYLELYSYIYTSNYVIYSYLYTYIHIYLFLHIFIFRFIHHFLQLPLHCFVQIPPLLAGIRIAEGSAEYDEVATQSMASPSNGLWKRVVFLIWILLVGWKPLVSGKVVKLITCPLWEEIALCWYFPVRKYKHILIYIFTKTKIRLR